MSKKIIHIITLSELAGAQIYVRNIVNYSENRNNEYQIISGADGNAFDNLDAKKHPLTNLVRSISFIKDIKAYKDIKNLLKTEQPDVVHCHSSKAGFLGRLAAKRAGVKNIIYTAHGFVFKEPLNPFKRILYYLVEKVSAKWTDKLICVSKEDYEWALRRKFVPKEKLFYIPNGVDLNEFRRPSSDSPVANSIEMDGKSELRGVCVANFYKTKGHKYLVEAVKNSGNKAIFVDLIGELGPEKNGLKKVVVEQGLAEQISFLGYRDNVSELLAEYDFFILPSVKEGFPYSVLEAAAVGLPIIATAVGGIKEIVEDGKNGLLCRPKHSEDLTKALNTIAEGKKLEADMTKIARFDIRQVVKEIENLY